MSIERDVQSYFNSLKDYFKTVLEGEANEHQLLYDLCSNKILVRYSNASVRQAIGPNFKPLLAADSKVADLQINLCDHNSKSWPVPLPRSLLNRIKDQEIRKSESVHLFRGDRFWILWNECTPVAEVMVIDMAEGEAIVCLRHSGQALENAYPSPLRNVFSTWLSAKGWVLLHASAVGTKKGGVLIAGSNGQGKSTVAASCVGSRLRFAGDDAIFVSSANLPIAHLLYPTCSIWLKEVKQYPRLLDVPYLRRLGSEKATFSFATKPDWLIKKFPIKAVFITEFGNEKKSKIRLITTGVALKRIAPSSLFRVIGDPEEGLARIFELLTAVPCYCLTLGTEHQDLPDLLAEFLENSV